MAAWTYDVISKEVENHILKHDWLITHLCMHKQPTLTKQWKYFCANISYIVISDTLVASFLDVFFLNARFNIFRVSCEPKKERFSFRKKLEFVWVTKLFWLPTLLSMSFFVAVFVYSPPLPNWCTYSVDVWWCSVWWYHE